MEKIPWKSDRKVLLVVTGGIAAYKAPSLVRTMIKAGCEVKVVLTSEAEKFVSPMVLSVLSGNRTWIQDDFLSDEHGWEIPHIRLAEWADIVVIAPATANAISNAARGEGQTLPGSILLATRSNVLFVPSMNEKMFEHTITQQNINILLETGYRTIEPGRGYLACGYEARGRMPDNSIIMEEIWRTLCPGNDLDGKTVLVTAGPTREFIDPVRFISNRSSGKMGLAIARGAWYRGAQVILVHGPIGQLNTYGFETVSVTSALEMYEEVISRIHKADYIVKAAAVGDYRPLKTEKNKIKKEGSLSSGLVLEMEENPDIAREIGKKKRKDQCLIGFAAESEKLEEYASKKLDSKNMDYIAANDITSSEGGFESDHNTIKLIGRNGTSCAYSGTKGYVADCIWENVLEKTTGPGIL
jgi:phosphopantothenoylcysteine decarboxylase/phosphopantothenate--cysteine ligase